MTGVASAGRPDRADSFWRDRRGNVLIEAAFGLVLLVGLLTSGVEIARYVLLQQKLDRVAMTIGDLVSRSDQPSDAEIADIFAAVPNLVEPFDFATDGRVVVSAVRREDGGTAQVVWQRLNSAGIDASSEIGTVGAAATLPDGLTPETNDSLYIAEVFYDFQPLFGLDLVSAHRLYHRSVYRARK
ncbi:hypothetical protein SAMN06265365_105192 [Tistlia consotensis]|uniref:Flp pilus assembly protein TadG n=1 Tax=Tistlia consotensis USBA 355 TaxID=560819 RepID=A0A1Y6BI95_9PROT|nr:hypothetical protein [Tistlia consotensis]SMF12712.1 hypothetical protein SAMN05428998_105106 [Tistlia consotensis USBA 355]SNR50932.1 hypothetical protein SAMN06265365_105192 [Tistlia consotensis]